MIGISIESVPTLTAAGCPSASALPPGRNPVHSKKGAALNASTVKIAVLDDYQDAAARYADWAGLPQAEVTIYRDHLADPCALAKRLRPFDVVCLMRERTRLDATMLARLPNLKLIVTTAMRNAALDVAEARRRGIIVCGTGAPQNGTPELIWLHILTLARNAERERAGLRQGRWQVSVGQDLQGATLGLVGLGRIGQQVARVANAFGMDMLAWSPNLTQARADACGARWASKEDLFSRSDFVVIAMQLRDSTRGLVGQAELACMKSTAFLINTSRAGLVDEEALIGALREDRIAGAGLDVFETEPLPPHHPVLHLPNALITPHLGYVTHRTYRQFYQETVEDILAWLQGRPIRQLDLAYQSQ